MVESGSSPLAPCFVIASVSVLIGKHVELTRLASDRFKTIKSEFLSSLSFDFYSLYSNALSRPMSAN